MSSLRSSRFKVFSPTMFTVTYAETLLLCSQVHKWCNITLAAASINATVQCDIHSHLQEPRRRPAKSNIITNSSVFSPQNPTEGARETSSCIIQQEEVSLNRYYTYACAHVCFGKVFLSISS